MSEFPSTRLVFCMDLFIYQLLKPNTSLANLCYQKGLEQHRTDIHVIYYLCVSKLALRSNDNNDQICNAIYIYIYYMNLPYMNWKTTTLRKYTFNDDQYETYMWLWWWWHDIETLSTPLTICDEYPSVISASPQKILMMRTLDFFCVIMVNELSNKRRSCRLLEIPYDANVKSL